MSAALIIGGIISALASMGLGIFGSAKNYKSQKETNETNLKMVEETNAANLQIARETNAQQLDLAKNAHQYEMEDLKSAGLNPVLTATGGSGASVQSLNAPQMKAPQMSAPQLNMSGVTSALNALTSAMAMGLIADSRNQTMTNNTQSRNEVLSSLYRRKAEALGKHSEASAVVSSAKQMHEAEQRIKKLNKAQLIKELESHEKKYHRDELPF